MSTARDVTTVHRDCDVHVAKLTTYLAGWADAQHAAERVIAWVGLFYAMRRWLDSTYCDEVIAAADALDDRLYRYMAHSSGGPSLPGLDAAFELVHAARVFREVRGVRL